MTRNRSFFTGLALLLILSPAGCFGSGSVKKTDFAGEWRTDWGCEITITDVTEQSFRFSFTGVTQSGNIGELEGKALFTADNKAVFAFENKELEITATFEFSIAGGKLIVALTEGDMAGYFGRGVNMQGEYAKAGASTSNDDLNTSASKAPPIENTENYANAHILLPDNWDGTFILANGFVWIDSRDVTLQKKYGIFPNEDNFYNDYELWNDDDRYYQYPLSPNVVIHAGLFADEYNLSDAVKMTVNQFGNYLLNRRYTEGREGYGMISHVTFSNGAITKIEEKFVP